MIKKVRFFKQNNNWYADIPNHTLEENEMVMGSDIVLEILSEGKDEVNMTLSDEESYMPLFYLNMTQHDDEGAYYRVGGILYYQMQQKLIDNSLYSPEIWICNVTHDIFGEHPIEIYVTNIEK